MKADQFYTVRTLADRLAITPLTVYRLVRQGKIPAVKIGKSIRFDPEAVDAYLESVRLGPEDLTNGNHEQRES
ncbi:MAG: helix-turn-helix domain-containing protein [Bacteroidetes bacterium]|nr:helix-turn-helix domain-containing protein [Bacteroidota bacterium]